MRTITVTGNGGVRAVPDSAVLHTAAAARAATLAEAVDQAEVTRATLVAVARRYTDAIASRDFEVWTDERGDEIVFQVSHAIRITCADLAAAGDLLGALAAEVGDGLRVNRVSLDLMDDTAEQLRARELAFEDARRRAEHLAGVAGATLGSVQTIAAHGGAEGRFAEAAAMTKVGFEPGETTVSASLTVTWELL